LAEGTIKNCSKQLSAVSGKSFKGTKAQRHKGEGNMLKKINCIKTFEINYNLSLDPLTP
jgi:hypothetical protein